MSTDKANRDWIRREQEFTDALAGGIKSVSNVRPWHRPRRRLLAIRRPPLSKMTDSDIDRWAEEFVGDMAAGMGRRPGPTDS